jgi:hypothetical protein
MAFYSQHAPRIWEDLYTAMIPDQVTLNSSYVRVFGTYTSGNKDVDRMMESNLTTVKIPIIKMLEYYDNGVTVQIPTRSSMLEIHRNIELYLGEWRHHIHNAINSDLVEHKDLVMGLEKFSKLIYGKAVPKEVVANPMLTTQIGLLNPLTRLQLESEVVSKPDYEGIGQLIRQKTKVSRY